MTTAQLAAQVRNPAVRAVLAQNDRPVAATLVYQFCEQSRLAMKRDVAAATVLAEAACAVARHAHEPRALAEALRMRGHVSYLSGNNRRAVAAYRRAVGILDRLGEHVDVGRTLSSALQSLIYLGLYDEALAWAARARRIFENDGDQLRLARLDSNEANILHRQDRYGEALTLYARAVEALRAQGDLDSTGIALRNMAVCHAALYDFDQALNCYRQAEAIYVAKGLPLLAAEIGDNIAQMYHLQGHYIAALETYRSSNLHQRVNTYHLAVARLDQSDLLLELNLFTEGAEMAADAAARLGKLGIRYERGKALLNLAIARFRLGDTRRSLQMLPSARRLFQRERNPVWEAAVDYYRAVFLLEGNDVDGARVNAQLALQRLEESPVGAKSIPVLLLLAKVEMKAGSWRAAHDYLRRAGVQGPASGTLPVRFQLAMHEGNLHEAEGLYHSAAEAYQQACAILETLRGQFSGDGLRLSFLADKLDCHQQLAGLALRGLIDRPLELTLELVEQVKSRSLAEAMLQEGEAGAEPEREEIRSLRRQLSWCYRQLDRAESARDSAAALTQDLRPRIQWIEERLGAEWASRAATRPDAPAGSRFSWEELRGDLQPDESLIEYFAAGPDLFAFVATPNGLRAKPLGPLAEVERVCRLLRFQMSRGPWSALVNHADPAWLAATLEHLRRLYGLLIAPLAPWLSDGHWIVVPHGALHRVPFHALHDGAGYLIDRRTISYAPSAAVHQICQNRSPSQGNGVSVFGLPDQQAPQILDEVTAVAARIDGAELFVGARATLARWKEESPRRRLLHLATHGLFRQDNPLFSSLRFSDGRLALYDLYNLRLKSALITLSGCATGVQEPGGGDEVMGLTRGLLVAGARAAQVSLWEVNDLSTRTYMGAFYSNLHSGQTIASASRQAMFTTRQTAPHPFHWAPFILTGRVNNSIPAIFYKSQPHPIEERTA